MEFTISTNQIIWFCSFIAGLWGLWKIVKEARKPNDDLKAKVEKHDQTRRPFLMENCFRLSAYISSQFLLRSSKRENIPV